MEFTAISKRIVEVNEAICSARPDALSEPEIIKAPAALEASSAEIARLVAEAARSLGCDAGLEAAETVIRAGMLRLGVGVLVRILEFMLCDQGHECSAST